MTTISEPKGSLSPQAQDAIIGDSESVDLENRQDEKRSLSGEMTASGHAEELERNFSLLNMCAVAIVIGNCWAITGSTIVR